jgi:hypothetical protein
MEAATAALTDAAAQDAGTYSAPESAQSEQVAVQPTEANAAPSDTSTSTDGTNQSSESFTHVDINSLPPELQQLAKQLQGDYTRKTQEAAPVRKLMSETGLSLEEAQQALQFVQSLNDPQNVQALYERLHQEYAQQQESVDESDGSFDDPRDRQLQDLSQRIERFEREQQMAAARSQLQAAEQAVREAYPDFKDNDMVRVRRIALSFDGDVAKAAEEFNSWRSDVLSQYIQSKGTVQAGAVPPNATAHAETPHSFANLDEATQAAAIKYANDL